jgi:hypothetical protein
MRLIGATQMTRGVVERGNLTADRKTYVPEGLSDPGQFELEYLFDFSASDYDDYFPSIDASRELITISYPAFGYATPAKLSGYGFFVAASTPEIASDVLAVGTATVQWEGGDGSPALTEAVS